MNLRQARVIVKQLIKDRGFSLKLVSESEITKAAKAILEVHKKKPKPPCDNMSH